jgi:hypothetical protein
MNGPGVAMNSVGGPVGGPAMAAMQQSNETKMDLNTCIYDHLLQMRQYDLAREFRKQNPQVKTKIKNKANGVSDADPKRPDDLPDADVIPFRGDSSFLSDWWAMFWDLFYTARRPGVNGTSSTQTQYLQQQKIRLSLGSATKMQGVGNIMTNKGIMGQQMQVLLS